MLLFLLLGVSSVIGILLLFIFVPYIEWSHAADPKGRSPSIPIFLIVVLAGTVGAFFSSLERLYNFREMPPILYDRHFGKESSFLFVYSLVPALVGGISAAVLYLIFAAVLLSGSFFPTFVCSASPNAPHDGSGCGSLTALYDSYAPKEAADYAKAILWGFVAGFAERLVPGLLNNFAEAANKDSAQDSGTSGTAASASGNATNGSRDPATWPDAAAATEAALHHDDAQELMPASRGMANLTSSLPLGNERG